MRYEDWDVLLFTGDSPGPVKEFRVACHVTHDVEFSHTHGSFGLPTMTGFVPSVPANTHFYISIHSWRNPHVSQFTRNYSKHTELVQFEARIFVDGRLLASATFDRKGPWPQLITNTFEITKSGDLAPLRFPQFRQEVLHQNYWSPADELGRIKIIISEGFPRDSLSVPVERVKNVVAFSFQHAPLEVLESSSIAWPNPQMWRRSQDNLVLPVPTYHPENGAESHSHSPRRRSSTASKGANTNPYTWDNSYEALPGVVNGPGTSNGGFDVNPGAGQDANPMAHAAGPPIYRGGNGAAGVPSGAFDTGYEDPFSHVAYLEWVASGGTTGNNGTAGFSNVGNNNGSWNSTGASAACPVRQSSRATTESNTDQSMPDYISAVGSSHLHQPEPMQLSSSLPGVADILGGRSGAGDSGINNTPTHPGVIAEIDSAPSSGTASFNFPMPASGGSSIITGRLGGAAGLRVDISSLPHGLMSQPLALSAAQQHMSHQQHHATLAPVQLPPLVPAPEIKSRKEARGIGSSMADSAMGHNNRHHGGSLLGHSGSAGAHDSYSGWPAAGSRAGPMRNLGQSLPVIASAAPLVFDHPHHHHHQQELADDSSDTGRGHAAIDETWPAETAPSMSRSDVFRGPSSASIGSGTKFGNITGGVPMKRHSPSLSSASTFGVVGGFGSSGNARIPGTAGLAAAHAFSAGLGARSRSMAANAFYGGGTSPLAGAAPTPTVRPAATRSSHLSVSSSSMMHRRGVPSDAGSTASKLATPIPALPTAATMPTLSLPSGEGGGGLGAQGRPGGGDAHASRGSSTHLTPTPQAKVGLSPLTACLTGSAFPNATSSAPRSGLSPTAPPHIGSSSGVRRHVTPVAPSSVVAAGREASLSARQMRPLAPQPPPGLRIPLLPRLLDLPSTSTGNMTSDDDSSDFNHPHPHHQRLRPPIRQPSAPAPIRRAGTAAAAYQSFVENQARRRDDTATRRASVHVHAHQGQRTIPAAYRHQSFSPAMARCAPTSGEIQDDTSQMQGSSSAFHHPRRLLSRSPSHHPHDLYAAFAPSHGLGHEGGMAEEGRFETYDNGEDENQGGDNDDDELMVESAAGSVGAGADAEAADDADDESGSGDGAAESWPVTAGGQRLAYTYHDEGGNREEGEEEDGEGQDEGDEGELQQQQHMMRGHQHDGDDEYDGDGFDDEEEDDEADDGCEATFGPIGEGRGTSGGTSDGLGRRRGDAGGGLDMDPFPRREQTPLR